MVVRNGETDCGAILWEVKRAANWGADWPAKLIADRDASRALIGVIVSESLPAGITSFGQVGDVWVSGFCRRCGPRSRPADARPHGMAA